MVVAARRFSLRTDARSVLAVLGYVLLLLVVAIGLSRWGLPFLKALPVLAAAAAPGAFLSGLISMRGLRTVPLLR